MSQKQLLKRTLIVIIAVILGTLGLNYLTHQSLFNSFPWGFIIIVILFWMMRIPRINKEILAVSYFIGYMIYFYFFGGYTDWTSWIIFTVLALFITLMIYLPNAEWYRRYRHGK